MREISGREPFERDPFPTPAAAHERTDPGTYDDASNRTVRGVAPNRCWKTRVR
jgi:hypothetical protein